MAGDRIARIDTAQRGVQVAIDRAEQVIRRQEKIIARSRVAIDWALQPFEP